MRVFPLNPDRLSRLLRSRRARRVAGVGALGLVLLLFAYRVVSDRGVTREDASAPREPKTGIRVGFEDRWLGPEDAPRAALFVHGFVGATSNFGDLPERLAERGWRVRVMRLPGHGTSPRDFETTTPDELVGAVRAELAELKRRHARVAVVSHSMGGALSTLAVSRDGADALILGAPYFGVTRRWWYILAPETWTRLASPFVRWVYKGKLFIQVNCKEAKRDIDSYTWVPTRGALALAKLGRRAREREVLAKIACPTLMLMSKTDVAASPERAAAAFEGIAAKGKRIVWLPNSNHHIYRDCDKERVINETLAFLEGI